MFLSCYKEAITPNSPEFLGGFVKRDRKSEGILDDLFVTTFLLEYGNNKILFLSYDLLAVDKYFTEHVKSEINRVFGIEKESIIVCATHTHSAPEGFPRYIRNAKFSKDEYINGEYVDFVVDKTIKSLENAIKNREEVRVYFGSGISVSAYSNRISEELPFNKCIYEIKFVTNDGNRKGTILNFSCHPTVLGENNYKISGDLFGSVRSIYEEKNGGLSLSLNGTAGDISTRYTRKSFEASEIHRLGELIVNDFSKINDYFEIKQFSFERKDIFLNFNQRDLKKEIDFDKELNNLKNKINNCEDIKEKRKFEVQESFLMGILKDIENMPIKEREVKISIFNLGCINIITVPGEPSSDLKFFIDCLNLKVKTIIIGYAEDYVGYIVPKDNYENVSYESLAAILPKGALEKIEEIIKENI